ncbi:MAG: hypothetical protein IJP68_00935, partial [Selenomonadaceae bacterium]|nr:hypothetical protein [Selenomonadaceae bacterium]
SCEYTFDDRIEKIELINGNAVQDYGHVESGDVYSVESMFTRANYLRVLQLWKAREFVTYTDEAGIIYEHMRLVCRRVRRDKNFPNYYFLTFELWRV